MQCHSLKLYIINYIHALYTLGGGGRGGRGSNQQCSEIKTMSHSSILYFYSIFLHYIKYTDRQTHAICSSSLTFTFRMLKQFRANREEENELMKNVEGWKTGTLWGEPVYHNVRSRWIWPATEEYLAHVPYWKKFYMVYDTLNH